MMCKWPCTDLKGLASAYYAEWACTIHIFCHYKYILAYANVKLLMWILQSLCLRYSLTFFPGSGCQVGNMSLRAFQNRITISVEGFKVFVFFLYRLLSTQGESIVLLSPLMERSTVGVSRAIIVTHKVKLALVHFSARILRTRWRFKYGFADMT